MSRIYSRTNAHTHTTIVAKIHHPDKNGDPLKFKALDETFKFLQECHRGGCFDRCIEVWNRFSETKSDPAGEARKTLERSSREAPPILPEVEAAVKSLVTSKVLEVIRASWRLSINSMDISSKQQRELFQKCCRILDVTCYVLRLALKYPCLFKEQDILVDEQSFFAFFYALPLKEKLEEVDERFGSTEAILTYMIWRGGVLRDTLDLCTPRRAHVLIDHEMPQKPYLWKESPRFAEYQRFSMSGGGKSPFSTEDYAEFAKEREQLRNENLGLKRKLEETKVREIDVVISNRNQTITCTHTGDTSVGGGKERQSTKGSRRTEGRKCPRCDGVRVSRRDDIN
jgi:hypothetical protein